MSGQSGRRSRSSRRKLVRKSDTLEIVVEGCDAVLLFPLSTDDGVVLDGTCSGLLVFGGARVDLVRERPALDRTEAITVSTCCP
jgi:hypothetical protein